MEGLPLRGRLSNVSLTALCKYVKYDTIRHDIWYLVISTRWKQEIVIWRAESLGLQFHLKFKFKFKYDLRNETLVATLKVW